MSGQFSILELLSVAVSRELRDGELAFIGLGVGERAFALAVGVPSVAIRLAQLSHAPSFTAMYGVIIGPRLDEIPTSFSDPNLIAWRSEAQIPVEHALDMFKRGMMDIGFISGVQIDQYGNLNSVCIGPHEAPKTRLVGCIAQSDHAAYAGRTIIIIPHERRRFVPRVDFISAVGHLAVGKDRKALGLPGGGPSRVFTDMAVLGFDADSLRMKLETVHPGFTVKDVVDATGFELLIPNQVPETECPSQGQLELIRNEIDRNGIFLRGELPA